MPTACNSSFAYTTTTNNTVNIHLNENKPVKVKFIGAFNVFLFMKYRFMCSVCLLHERHALAQPNTFVAAAHCNSAIYLSIFLPLHSRKTWTNRKNVLQQNLILPKLSRKSASCLAGSFRFFQVCNKHSNGKITHTHYTIYMEYDCSRATRFLFKHRREKLY